MPDKIQGPEESLETPQTAKYSPSQIAIFLGGIIFLLVLAGAAFTAFKSSSNIQQNNNGTQKEETKPLNVAPYTLIYGAWTQDNSLIKAFDLQSGKEYTLAALPTNVKNVHVLDKNRLVYIDKTQDFDMGKDVVIYSTTQKNTQKVIDADDGFGIDLILLSPDKTKIAIWEKKLNPTTNVMLGGQSRVYVSTVTPGAKPTLLYDETASSATPIHEPVAVLNDGSVYFDSYTANAGPAWSQGMSEVHFDGTHKEDLPTMQNGTYGTQPQLSPNGKYLAFAGYDGSKGSGTALVGDYRRAVLTPNTIEILDTSTNQRKKLSVSNQNSYPAVFWANNSSQLFYLQLEKGKTGYYAYDLNSNKTKQLTTTQPGATPIAYISNTIISGEKADNASAMGNLGANYSYAFSALQAQSSSQSSVAIPLSDSLVQYISLLPSSSVNASEATAVSNRGDGNNQLQLQTFAMKPSLAPIRAVQNSNPPATVTPPPSSGCKSNCTVTLPPIQKTNTSSIPIECNQFAQNQCTAQGDNSDSCQKTTAQNGAITGACIGHPLYLYGPVGTHVNVQVLTPVYASTPPYKNGYNLTLGNNGNIIANNISYPSISFHYQPALPIIHPPMNGVITTNKELNNTIHIFGQKLGLNAKETEDLTHFADNSVHSPYIFLSFFDDKTSQEMLPITFSPKPDVYRNIVFYFKQLSAKPNYSVQPPTFEKIQRHGFTAIEISEMVE